MKNKMNSLVLSVSKINREHIQVFFIIYLGQITG